MSFTKETIDLTGLDDNQIKSKLSELFIILSVGTQKDYKGILNQIKKMSITMSYLLKQILILRK